jgi:hypothetical protein
MVVQKFLEDEKKRNSPNDVFLDQRKMDRSREAFRAEEEVGWGRIYGGVLKFAWRGKVEFIVWEESTELQAFRMAGGDLL